MMRKRFGILLTNTKLFFGKFFHQLRLLLWKSFVIKKRSPFVFLFELCVPLVLFLIMCAIRKKQYAKPIDLQFFDAWPLPSAGFIPLMQGFCSKKNGIKNANGYYEYPNSTAHEMMQQIEKINANNFFDMNILDSIIKNDELPVNRSKRDASVNTDSNIIKNFFYLQSSIHELSKLSDYFPNNLCSKRYNNETNDYDYDYKRSTDERSAGGRGVASLFDSKLDASLRMSLMKNSGFVGLWLNMQKTFCGKSTIAKATTTAVPTTTTTTTTPQSRLNQTTEETSEDVLGGLDLTEDQFKSISLLFHLLYSNPMIYFAPNGTVIRNLIKKSNQTFMLLEQVNRFSREWLEKSPKIVKYLQDNETRAKIAHLNELKDEFGIFSDEYKNLKAIDADALINDIQIINSIACSWLYLMSGVNLNIFKGFSNENDLVNYFLNDAYSNNQTVIASVVFTNVNENSTSLPPYIRYKIRQNSSFTQTTKKIRDRYWYPSARSWNYYYYIFGFAWLQDLIDRSIIDTHSNRSVLEPGLYVHQFPYPCYLSDSFLEVIEHVMPLCLAISFIYTVSMISQTIVYEKEVRLKEVMKIMGLYNSVHWIAWFITYFIQLSFIMVIVTLILHYGKILMHSDPFLIFFLLELYVIATILFSFFVSVWYSKAKLAAACAGIVYFLSYVPCMYIIIREEVATEVIPKWVKICASLLSTSAFGLASKYIAFYENIGTGIQWSNINKSPLEDDSFTCFLAVKCMILDCFLYVFLTWYVENINPGYGIPKPWYFIFQRSYWCDEEESKSKKDGFFKRLFSRKTQKISFTDADQAKFLRLPNTRRHLFEPEPLNLNIGVQVKNLTKVYSNGKVAVDNLSINFFENQITSFLGHNGAGKSTTMSVLSGLMPATDGSAFIYGKDIRTHMNQIRCSLGFVPQHNILFDKLTVEEHLWFYAKLKEVSEDVIKKLIDNMLNDTGLKKKRYNLVHTLSGGMQRKLSVAIAFVGDANVVLLDEPTAGVDPYARRAIWDLLLKFKYGRTIILSTHYMDEAELLGDRIAIISNGVLQCCGTSLFLKNVLGEGNHMTVVKREVTTDNDDELIDIGGGAAAKEASATMNSIQQTSRLINFVQQYAPSAFLKEETLREYHFVIPLHERTNRKFWYLFDDLKKNAGNLNISSYGMHDVSLEEVFLKAAQLSSETAAATSNIEHDEILVGDAKKDRQSCWSNVKKCFRSKNNSERLMNATDADTDDEKGIDDIGYIYEDLERGWRLVLKQFLATIIKRYLYNARNWKSLITQIILPACFICVAMTVALSAPGFQDLPSLELSSSQFYPLTKPEGTYLPFSYYLRSPDDITSKREEFSASTKDIIETLRFVVGLGATCTLNNNSVTLQELFDNKTSQLNPDFFGYDDVCRLIFNKNTDIDWTYFKLRPKSTFKISSNNTSLNDKPFYPKCKCLADSSGFECSDESTFNYPPQYSTIGHETLLNISETSINETLYYLYTTDMYRLKRYGALSFDNEIIKNKLNTNFVDIHTVNTHKEFKVGEIDILAKFNTRRLASVWYNHKAFHSMPIYINTMNNALLRANVRHALNTTSELDSLLQSNAYGISVVNHPMNHTNNYLSTEYILQGSDVIISIFTIVAMSFVPASFVLFLVYERSTKSLHLQFLSGLNPLLYWITNFLWDLFNYMLPASCVIIILKLFNVPAYVDGSNFPAVISLFLLYGWSISPLMYPSSFLFKEPSNAYIFLIVINLFTGITCVVSSFLFQVFAMNSPDLNVIYQVLKTVYLVFPPYCLGRGLIDIAYNDYYNIFYSKTGQAESMRSPFAWDICTRNLVSMAVIGALFWVFTLLLEYDFFNHKKYKNFFSRKKNTSGKQDEQQHNEQDTDLADADPNEDVDVRQERLRVLNNLKANHHPDHLIVRSLKKIYNMKSTRFLGLRKFFRKICCRKARNSKNKQLTAVHSLCFSVPRGECFGLLGVNGAGKTTTFQMLTTDLEPTKGQISIAEADSVMRNKKTLVNSILNRGAYWNHVGYCPQFDALYDELTPADHLRLFARLKGVKTKYEHIVVRNLMRRLDLLEYADKPVGSLSLGNKRKLSTALALVGNPSIVYLDEPTSGMDPCSRRRLWECVLDLTRNKNQSVLLTSHSMEECEVLCTRIAIMVDGKFKCLGSVQHLKTRFGDGYTLTVKIRETPNTDPDQLDYLCEDVSSSSINSSISNNSMSSSTSSSSLQVQKILNSNKYISLIYTELLKNISNKCKLKERHFNNVYQFELPCNYSENLNLGEIYRLIELNKLRFNIIDYSLTQNTLDNVFINFIKEHTDKKNLLKSQLQMLNKEPSDDIHSDDDELLIDQNDSLKTTSTTATTTLSSSLSQPQQSNKFKFPIHDNDEQLLLSSSSSHQTRSESIDVIKSLNSNSTLLNSSSGSNNLGYKLIENMDLYEEDYC